MLHSLEIFSGAGGLAKGVEIAGAKHKALIEYNLYACDTLRANYCSDIVYQEDVRNVDFQQFMNIDFIAGGPPCQPFSLGGKAKGYNDHRDMFPYAISAIRQLAPKAFVFENVKGLSRKSFADYLNYIILQLSYPEICKNNKDWKAHLSNLEKIHTQGNFNGLQYNVICRLVNAADYGVPQKRERIIIVGIRSDLNIGWFFPEETHSEDALLWTKYVTGDYWDRHGLLQGGTNTQINKDQQNRLLGKYGLFSPTLQPWQTIRDACSDLPDPQSISDFHPEHYYHAGAKSYPGHTGSDIDQPSKAIKAGDHGVPGGENMLRYPNGYLRYLTILEAKRIQTFPDDYAICGSWTEAMRQLGNAVPVKLGHSIVQSLLSQLIVHRQY